MAVNYDQIVSNMARELGAAGEDEAAKIAIVERYESEHPGLRAWFTDLIVKLAPVLARQREMEERLAELEERVTRYDQALSPQTRH